MPEYLVTWRAEILADTPEHAAQIALAMQRDPESLATIFEVVDLAQQKTIDVAETEGIELGDDD